MTSQPHDPATRQAALRKAAATRLLSRRGWTIIPSHGPHITARHGGSTVAIDPATITPGIIDQLTALRKDITT